MLMMNVERGGPSSTANVILQLMKDHSPKRSISTDH